MNVKFNKSELKILSCLLSEREAEMRRDLSDKDGKIYLEICGLKGKINGYLELIESDEEETNNEIRSASGVSLSDNFMNQDNIIKVRIKVGEELYDK